MATETLTIVLKADGTGLTGTIRVAEGDVRRFNAVLDASSGKVGAVGAASRRAGADVDALGAAGRRTTTSTRALATGLNTLRGTLATLGISYLVRETIEAGLTMDRLERSTAAAMGGMRRGAQELQFVRAEAERLGIYLPVLAQGYAGLAAATRGTVLQGEATRQIFLAVAEAGRAMNLSAEQIQGTLTALQQIAGKGTVSMEELRQQLGDRLPGAMQIAARSMGLTVSQFVKLVSEGKVLASDFLPKFAAEMRKASAAGVELAKNSPAAEFARLKTAVFEAAQTFVRSGLLQALGTDAGKAAAALRALVDSGALQKIAGLLATATKLAIAYFAVFVVAPAIMGAAATAIRAVAAAQLSANLAMTLGIKTSMTWAARMKAAAGVVFVAFASYQFGKWMRENFKAAEIAGIYFVRSVLIALELWRARTLSIIASVKHDFQAMFEAIGNLSAKGYEKLAKAADFIGLDSVAEKYRKAAEASRQANTADSEYLATQAKINTEHAQRLAQIKAVTGDQLDLAYSTGTLAEQASAAATAEDQLTDVIVDTGNASDDASKKLARLREAQAEFARENRRMAAELAGPAAQAQFDYADGVEQANIALAKHEATLGEVIKREQLLRETRDRALAQLAQEADVLGRVRLEMEQQVYLSGLSAQARRVEEQVIRAVAEAEAEANRQRDQSIKLSPARIAALRAELATAQEQIDFNEAQQQAAEDYRNSWINAVDSVWRATGDFITRSIHSWKDFGKTLIDIGKRWMSDLIAMWGRNGGLSAAMRRFFSGGFADAGSTGGGGGGFWSSLLGGGSSGSGGGGGFLSSIGGAIGRFFGFGGGSQGAAGTGWANAYGAGTTALAAGGGVLMPQYSGGAMAGAGSGGFGGLMQFGSMFAKDGTMAKFLTSPAAPWLGALGGAVWGFQQGGDTTGKILGGVAGGVAGYGLATGVGAGVAAYGAGAGIAGAGAAGLAAIPVVGWIALAAIAINAISGGKLFGTKYKMDSASNDFSYGDSGIAGSQSITKVKQRSLFGGRKWTTETSGLPADAVAALNEAFTAIDSAVVEAASRLGVDAPQLLSATFRQEFDKNGNLTKEFGTIAGRVYQEAQDAFNKRYLAENLLMVAGQVGHAAEIDTLANQFRRSPDALTDFATLMLAMQDDIQKSTQLWDDTDGAITRVVGVIQDLQQAGEQLAQTYARVIGAANAYGSFIAGIQTQITMAGLNDYQRAQLAVEQQYRSQVKQANDLAKALGLSGARAEDLAKIEQLRALSMAEVQKQFEAQKNTFLEDLGLSALGPGTDRDKLTESMNLLQQAAAAGDMQRAQQLAQQVLGFGRNLYASGSDYNALYGQVTGLVGGIDAGQVGFTDDALQSIADSLETLPTDIARAMFDLLAGQTTLPPPPVPTAPPPPPGTTPPPPPGSTGGGGSTGENKCVTATSYMDDGTQAIHSKAGDVHVTHLPGAGFDPHPIEAVGGAVLQPCVRLHLRGGGSWSGSISTPFNHVDASADLKDGEWSRAPDMAGKEVFVQRGSRIGLDTVDWVEDIGDQWVVPQSFGGRSFGAGDQPDVLVFSHNVMKSDFMQTIAYNTAETVRLLKSADLKAANV